MLLKCALIDDDPVFAEILKHYVSKIDFMELEVVYHDAQQALAMDFSKVDALFLDVEIPELSGIELLNSLPAAPPVVLVSAKKEYGADAFDHDSIDYLHKPVSFARFLKAANKLKQHIEQVRKTNGQAKNNLFVRQEGLWVRINPYEILYIKANDNDVLIRTAEKTYKVHSKLKEIYEQLPQADFLQVHRSYIVQLGRIDKVDGEIIEIANKTIPVSKTYLKEMYEQLNISRT